MAGTANAARRRVYGLTGFNDATGARSGSIVYE